MLYFDNAAAAPPDPEKLELARKLWSDDFANQESGHDIPQYQRLFELDGVNLIGYTPWGHIDLVSGGTGEMRKRYGFIYVDYNNAHEGDMSRSRKKSFYWYQKVCASNGEDLGE